MTNTNIKTNSSLSRATALPHKYVQIKLDIPLLLVTITLLIFGALMVYSASADFSLRVYGSMTFIFKRQITFMLLGLISIVALM
ncbi:MAG: hypothetical protein J7L73_09090, partial [Anaerolineales bacterium]|nr:hypothetical protein [Anaerolineales bacterium]